MHQAWGVQLVQDSILERLDSEDLARLASTCAALWGPATDRLWRNIPSLSVFLLCLPEGYKQDTIVSEDVERLDRYSAKVRRVHIESSKAAGIPKSMLRVNKGYGTVNEEAWYRVWDDIARVRPAQSAFLPNLREIHVNNIREGALMPLVGTITGANLTYIRVQNLHYKTHKGVVRRFLWSLTDTSKLRYLFVRDGQNGLVPPKLLEQSSLRQLRLPSRPFARGSADDQPQDLLPRILNSPSLENLTLSLTRDWSSPALQAMKGRKCLASLTQLWLDLTTFTSSGCGYPICAQRDIDGWTCTGERQPYRDARIDPNSSTSCPREPPQVFFDFLDHPRLRLLSIKFDPTLTSNNFMEFIKGVARNCDLQHLEELVLGGRSWFWTVDGWDYFPDPKLQPYGLQQGVRMLLPLPRLHTLRVTAAPGFVGHAHTLDMDLYREIAAGLQTLRTLTVGHENFTRFCGYFGTTHLELVPLQNLAAFCSLLPNLENVEVGTIDAQALGAAWVGDRREWISPRVTRLDIKSFANKEGNMDRLRYYMAIWFPSSNYADYVAI